MVQIKTRKYIQKAFLKNTHTQRKYNATSTIHLKVPKKKKFIKMLQLVCSLLTPAATNISLAQHQQGHKYNGQSR